MSPGTFICFEGLDGAGKSSVAAGTTRRLVDAGIDARFLARKDPECDDAGLRGRLELQADLIWGYGDTPIERFGDHHALFNMASWFAAIDRVRIRPLIESGVTVVMDNWCYKFMARMHLKDGLDPALADRCFAGLTMPDRVLFLDVTPTVAADRKSAFARGETGGFDGYGAATVENFVSYQTAVRDHLLRFSRELDWFVIDVDGIDEDEVVDRATAAILSEGRPPGPVGAGGPIVPPAGASWGAGADAAGPPELDRGDDDVSEW